MKNSSWQNLSLKPKYVSYDPFCCFCSLILVALWWSEVLQNLELKKTNDEKKAALAAQFAAEATLRRVHAAQKDDDMPPIEAILAPLEAELKLSRQEVMLYTLHHTWFCSCDEVVMFLLVHLYVLISSWLHRFTDLLIWVIYICYNWQKEYLVTFRLQSSRMTIEL